MNKKALIFSFVLSMFLFGNSFAQLSYGGGIGATFFMNDDITKSIDEGGLGLGTEFHYGAKLRYGILLTPVSLTAAGYWAKLKSDGSYEGYSVEYQQDFIVLSGGVEVTLLPGPIKPFIAADYIYTMWKSGEVKMSLNGNTSTASLDDASRSGLGFGVGAKFTLLPLIDVELVAKYNMHNLFNKEDEESDYNTYTITANVMF